MKLVIIKSSNILHGIPMKNYYRQYIDYEDIHRVYNSLDAALLGLWHINMKVAITMQMNICANYLVLNGKKYR